MELPGSLHRPWKRRKPRQSIRERSIFVGSVSLGAAALDECKWMLDTPLAQLVRSDVPIALLNALSDAVRGGALARVICI